MRLFLPKVYSLPEIKSFTMNKYLNSLNDKIMDYPLKWTTSLTKSGNHEHDDEAQTLGLKFQVQ